MVKAAAAFLLLANLAAANAQQEAITPYVNLGSVEAVEGLLDRLLPGSKSHFTLSLDPKAGPATFTLADKGGAVSITATGAAELAYGVGHYLREYCNMTIGWKRGGGSNVFIPSVWPKIGSSPVTISRNTPWSYMMNVCTHSYSLVWYSW